MVPPPIVSSPTEALDKEIPCPRTSLSYELTFFLASFPNSKLITRSMALPLPPMLLVSLIYSLLMTTFCFAGPNLKRLLIS
jgi:hypothetical protein